MLPASYLQTDSPYTAHSTIAATPFAVHPVPVAFAASPACDSLFQAIREGDADAVAALLSAGTVDVNAVHARTGHTLLMHAVTAGHIPIVEALLLAGASVNQPSDDGMTPLMLAAFSGYVAIAKILLCNGAGIDTVYEDGTTALMFAAMQGESDCAHALVDAGASLALRDRKGENAADIAADWLHDLLAQALRLRQQHDTVLADAAAEFGLGKATEQAVYAEVLHLDDLQVMGKLLAAGASPDTALADGRWPFATAAGGGARATGHGTHAPALRREPECHRPRWAQRAAGGHCRRLP